MRIIDNFLPNLVFNFIFESILDKNFAWYHQDGKVGKDGEVQFTHIFVNDEKNLSDKLNILQPILDKLEVKRLLKAKVNLTLRENVVRPFNFHVDVNNIKGNTAIFYMNTNNGKTLFENNKEVNSIANRIVVFGNSLKHTGTTHTDNKYRIVLNINYI
tara:strand:+ start:847 stop:1320 length:474 start_codon:yes stop_codon:yes gene_type:complete